MSTDKPTIAIDCKFKPVSLWLCDVQELNRDPNARAHWVTSTQAAMPYLPLVNLIGVNDSVKFTDSERTDMDVSTYNQNATGKRLNPVVIQSSRLRVGGMDLVAGDIYLFLNFTTTAMSVMTSTNIQHYQGLSCDRFKEFRDRVFVIRVSTVASPTVADKVHGVNNYFDRMIDLHCAVRSKRSEEYRAMMLFASECWNLHCNSSTQTQGNSLKIASVTELSPSVVHSIKDGQQVILKEIDFRVMSTPVAMNTANPVFEENLTHSSDIVTSFRDHAFSCFIVDNTSAITDRFYNFMGKAVLIPKIKDSSLVEGLYTVAADKSSSLRPEDVTPLSEIDKLPYVYASLQEAAEGVDLTSLSKRQHEEAIAAQTRENNLQAMRFARERSELEHKLSIEREESASRMREREAEHKRELDAMDRAHKAEVARLGIDHKRAEHDFAYDKYNMDRSSLFTKSTYEEGKFKRDSTIETIKTAGSLAALAVAGMMAYKRFA